jgi:hypothetical protein
MAINIKHFSTIIKPIITFPLSQVLSHPRKMGHPSSYSHSPKMFCIRHICQTLWTIHYIFAWLWRQVVALARNFTVLPKIYWTIHFFAAYDFYERIFHYKLFKNVRKYGSNLSQWQYIRLRFLISYLFHHYMIYLWCCTLSHAYDKWLMYGLYNEWIPIFLWFIWSNSPSLSISWEELMNEKPILEFFTTYLFFFWWLMHYLSIFASFHLGG